MNSQAFLLMLLVLIELQLGILQKKVCLLCPSCFINYTKCIGQVALDYRALYWATRNPRFEDS